MFFGFNFSAATLVILSVEKCMALYFPLKTKTICTVRTARRVSLVTGAICLLWAVQFSLTGEVLTNGTYCVQTANNILDPEYFLILYNVIVPVTYSYGPFTIIWASLIVQLFTNL